MIEDIGRPDIGNIPATMIGICQEMQTAVDGITLDCLNVTTDDNIMSSVDIRRSLVIWSSRSASSRLVMPWLVCSDSSRSLYLCQIFSLLTLFPSRSIRGYA